MNQDERAALERLLEYVGRGFCAVQSDCKMLKKYLADQDKKRALAKKRAVTAKKAAEAAAKPVSMGHWQGND